MSDYVSAGFSPEGFWRLTPREVAAHMGGARKRFEYEHRQSAWLALQIGVLTRWDVKRYPKLDDLCGTKPTRQKQSAEQMLMIAQLWNAAVNKHQKATHGR